ncbi:NAD(P)/FAD-dependent oxidoreductase [Nannocystis pusilla]|uniref:NAD(P)/FAD-dependent oxidoreductase n=1 Tax=Nannocystis pusilla TaxID=889268 RepID=UPI003DA3B15C
MNSQTYDVAILGAGIAGSTLAAILARQGFRVLLLEKGAHPRFAVGEAMQPQSSMLLWILGERFDVPELQHLSCTQKILRHVTRNVGVKKTFGFLYHDEGQPQDPNKGHLLVPPPTPLASESHLFRADIDHYVVKAAIKYGTDYRERTDVVDFELNDDGVVLRTAAGEVFHARYLCDGTGHKSLVAERMGLRPEVPPLRTQSRTIFTHMRGFQRYDDIMAPHERPGLTRGYYEGTLHHVIDGGWFWIIRFDNVPGSESDLTSVGLTLDMRKYPQRGIPPEQEFWEVVNRYPSIARHLQGAEVTRPWVGTGRLQFTATDSVGKRFFLLSHAHGFIDALYSRGMINTFETIHALAPRLIQALKDDDFDPARFEYPRKLQDAMLADNDRMVHNSFRSFANFETWNAFLRVWLINILFGDLRMFRVCLKYLESGDKADFALLDADPLPLEPAPGEDPLEDMRRFTDTTFDRWEAGEIDAEQAATLVFELLGRSPLPPIHPWGDPAAHHTDVLPEKLKQMIEWGKTEAKWPLNRWFDFDLKYLERLRPDAAA